MFKSLFLPKFYNKAFYGFFRRGHKKTANRRLHKDIKRERNAITPLTLYEDRRLYYPEPRVRPVRTFSGTPARLRIPKKKEEKKGYITPAIGYENPARTIVCVRRKQRREVLHAIGVTGNRGLKKPKYTATSQYSC